MSEKNQIPLSPIQKSAGVKVIFESSASCRFRVYIPRASRRFLPANICQVSGDGLRMLSLPSGWERQENKWVARHAFDFFK